MSQIHLNENGPRPGIEQAMQAGGQNAPAELRGAHASGWARAGRILLGIFTLGISEGIRALVHLIRVGKAPAPRVREPNGGVPQALPREDWEKVHFAAEAPARNSISVMGRRPVLNGDISAGENGSTGGAPLQEEEPLPMPVGMVRSEEAPLQNEEGASLQERAEQMQDDGMVQDTDIFGGNVQKSMDDFAFRAMHYHVAQSMVDESVDLGKVLPEPYAKAWNEADKEAAEVYKEMFAFAEACRQGKAALAAALEKGGDIPSPEAFKTIYADTVKAFYQKAAENARQAFFHANPDVRPFMLDMEDTKCFSLARKAGTEEKFRELVHSDMQKAVEKTKRKYAQGSLSTTAYRDACRAVSNEMENKYGNLPVFARAEILGSHKLHEVMKSGEMLSPEQLADAYRRGMEEFLVPCKEKYEAVSEAITSNYAKYELPTVETKIFDSVNSPEEFIKEYKEAMLSELNQQVLVEYLSDYMENRVTTYGNWRDSRVMDTYLQYLPGYPEIQEALSQESPQEAWAVLESHRDEVFVYMQDFAYGISFA